MSVIFNLKGFDDSLHKGLKDVYLENLKAATPFDSGDTSRAWKLVKDEPFKYRFVNTQMTEPTRSGPNSGVSYPIVGLLELGTRPHIIRPIQPKKALH